MHDGRYRSLEEVLKHYTESIPVFVDSESEAVQTLDPLLANPQITGISLTAEEQKDIIAFLNALTDEIFLKNIALADPGIGNAF